jgi:hypothetical protein
VRRGSRPPPEDRPVLDHEVRDVTDPVLDPGAPPPTRSTPVGAKRSGGHSSNSQPIVDSATACNTDVGVGVSWPASILRISAPGRPDRVGGDDHLVGIVPGLISGKRWYEACGNATAASAGLSTKLW